MPHRAPSPAASESEFDISKALLNDAGEPSDGYAGVSSGKRRAGDRQNAGFAQDLDDEDQDGGDTYAISAAQQAANRKASNLKGKTVKKGGGFQAMGLNGTLLKAITRKGFSVPTPIQRKTIPLLLDGQDVVGMARTGSGKTAAFVIPMIEKLKSHSAKVGARALILSPSRELALQTLKVVKELGRGTDLKTVLVVGGDPLEEQFREMTMGNPDVVIATPGRFVHVKSEMRLDLSSIQYIVFDEADRLFEMGFAAQLTEILHALPTSRQTLLFSATLPKSLVEFARAGLQEPKLIRLDAESKISPDLESAFFTVKSAEKEGALLHILRDIIKMPLGETEAARKAKEQLKSNSKKRKRDEQGPGLKEAPTPVSTIVFAATKHHVEYLASLLRSSGYAVSYVYGSLDQTARKMQVQDFRTGMTNILVVTDVAARGIDIPVLANVINYDFPSQPKIFVHRVGRTARAGMKGWSYSLVRDADIPYLLDLQLFLSKRFVLGRTVTDSVSFAEDVVTGSLVRDKMERSCEWVTKLLAEDDDLEALRTVAAKGEKLYMRTRNAASSESVKRAKEVMASASIAELNLLFNDDVDVVQLERERMLAQVSGFRPAETVFEIGKRGSNKSEAAEIMRKRREKVDPQRRQDAKDRAAVDVPADSVPVANGEADQDADGDADGAAQLDLDPVSEDELEITFSQPSSRHGKASNSWEDSENFMSYAPRSLNMAEDRGYGVHSGGEKASHSSNFVEAARGATMDLNNDDSKGFGEPSKARGMRWDKKSKKYVARANDEDGSKGAKMVRGESGQKIAASFRSGRFDAWKKSNKIDRLPRTGEMEAPSNSFDRGRRYKHKAEKAPKEADKFRDDYYKRKKKVESAREKRIGKFKDGGAKNELRGVDDVRKQRQLKEKRKEKNARPTKKRKF
ncbi:ATP-dependent RNA helicase dbp10 [Coniosporium apollinis]|uniref:RNA helicase n=1 Tax=Coniosporium apollinis TaxID=61459 RepID=A0ABQ9NTN9_9PEZI|nr:ATP-dependent RNA helicase dbp10 [Coniosporium apollinis]